MQHKNRGRPPVALQGMLEAADMLFAQSKLPGSVTMDAIAAAASVGKGTLFRAFGNRDGLLDALWATKLAILKERVTTGVPPFDESATPLDRLIAFLDSILMFKIANRHLIHAREATGGLLQSPHYRWMHAKTKNFIMEASNQVDEDYAIYSAHALLSALHIDLIDEMLAQGLSVETIRRLQAARGKGVIRIV